MSVTFDDIKPGNIVNIVADTTLLGEITGAEVLSISNYKAAKQISDIDTLQASLFSTLEDTTVVDNTAGYTYIIIEQSNGNVRALAGAWLKSITVVETIPLQLNLNVDNNDELAKLKKRMTQWGYDVTYTLL